MSFAETEDVFFLNLHDSKGIQITSKIETFLIVSLFLFTEEIGSVPVPIKLALVTSLRETLGKNGLVNFFLISL